MRLFPGKPRNGKDPAIERALGSVSGAFVRWEALMADCIRTGNLGLVMLGRGNVRFAMRTIDLRE